MVNKMKVPVTKIILKARKVSLYKKISLDHLHTVNTQCIRIW